MVELVPRSKLDVARARAAAAAGYPAVDPILPELLEWLQDCNWPVAQVLAPALAEIGEPLATHIRPILDGNDDCWKYSVVQTLVAASAPLVEALETSLRRIAENPTPGEVAEGVHEEAVQILAHR